MNQRPILLRKKGAAPPESFWTQLSRKAPANLALVLVDANRPDAQLQVERWQAWRSFTRSQWFPAPLTANQMQEQLEEDLRHSHPRAIDLVVERIEVVRR